MKRVVFGCVMLLAACEDMPMSSGGGGGTGGGGAVREYLVLGSSMSFEDCRARGGLIIRDQGSPMIACDPHVIRAPAPLDEFNNPSANTAAPETDS